MDKQMKLSVCKVSEGFENVATVEINTIEDLIALREQYQHDIVLTEDYDLDSESDVKLLVYDDYME